MAPWWWRCGQEAREAPATQKGTYPLQTSTSTSTSRQPARSLHFSPKPVCLHQAPRRDQTLCPHAQAQYGGLKGAEQRRLFSWV